MKLYCLKSKSLNYLNNPIVAASDSEILFNLRNAVQKGQDASLANNIEDLELVVIGEFDPSVGILTDTKQLVYSDDTVVVQPYVVDFDLKSFLPDERRKPDGV